ncbi:MAG: ATP-binding protein [Geminicoccaceae bacterium]
MTQLLQATLENAMLKRDIDGLRDVVARLATQSDVERVMILEPSGEVRFASSEADLGRVLDLAGGALCPGCALAPGETRAMTAVVQSADGDEMIRSVQPVRNREPCQGCHGPIAANPVNGILVVDYLAGGLQGSMLRAGLLMSGLGLVAAGLAVVGVWLALEAWVLRPLGRLGSVGARLGAGELSARVGSTGRDEIAVLGRRFDAMAGDIERYMEVLASRERFLQALLDAIPDGIRVIGPDFGVEMVNRAFLELHGSSDLQVVGAPCYRSSHGRDSPCPTPLVTCPLQELTRSGASLTCRHRHVRADGSELFVEVSAAAFETRRDGRTELLIIESIRDLSKDVQLSHEHKLSELGMLAAGVAHEIYNPLTSIRLALRSLQTTPGRSTAGETDYLALIDEEIEKCIEITYRLLKLSMPKSRTPTLVELNQLVAEVVSLLQGEAESRNVAIELDLADNLRIVGSDSEMRMLVLNLVQNAFHAMPGGGRLAISGRIEAGEVVLAVKDDGVGIPEADLERIFHPFWSRRADRDGHAGTGLGLSICHNIATSHDGRIGVRSEVGEGSVFTVRLPLARP